MANEHDTAFAQAASDRAAAEVAGARVGAQAVADAVNKVAMAAVAEVQKAPSSTAVPGFIATGNAGGRFTLHVTTTPLFSSSGTVFLNGKVLATDGWGATHIEGKLPADAKSGEIVVQVDAETKHRAYLKL